ncbi:MAG: preprotein translocase subunit SecA [Candidatus Cloacimonetes bacterium]|nr:preprotein translocase subunit SecA [Candidatus Cloacimonadota bacterium]
MFKKLILKVFGNRYDRELKKVKPQLDKILEIYPSLQSKSDEELRERVKAIRADIASRISGLETRLEELQRDYQVAVKDSDRTTYGNQIDVLMEKIKTERHTILGEYLPEVFAIVKDTCRRMTGQEFEVRGTMQKWEMVPYDVQLIGGIALHEGNIAEMATGEGKTLVATMPLFLNALSGHSCHLVTVNDYLASRDAEWMKPVFEFHGMTVGVNINGLTNNEKRAAYNCDITYGTNSEFGFDYLRDNMAIREDQLVQGKLYYAIVDEVDSVLVDEARTPLIISGPVAESKNFYPELKPMIKQLVEKQNILVNGFLGKLRSELEKENRDENVIGNLLLKIYRGAPKNKSFLKMMKQGELKKHLQDFESMYIREKKLHLITEELFFFVEERQNSVELSDKGNEFMSSRNPNLFIVRQLDELLAEVDDNPDLSTAEKIKAKEKVQDEYFDKNERLHNIKQLLKAYTVFEKDVEYVVQDSKVMIVDEFTGRMMPGRRFSDGLHQALEAKENCVIEEATQTFATITLQNFFRMYDKLAGMTGTAITEEGEFLEIYELPVMVIPTNEPVSRIDHDDLIYLTRNEKYQAIINEIEFWHKRGKPVLVGTVTVEVSEKLGRLLSRKKIEHKILNAKFHESEAEIIKNAGDPGSVTIATNMAGRGTDIKLGKGVVSKDKSQYQNLDHSLKDEYPFGLPIDGLHVIGTERHESRRIDRQLRGRAGRQGDPGTSRFYLSLEDDLMRLFGSDRIAPMMLKMGFQSGEAITHPWMNKAVENAQKRVEGYNFEIRKQLIKYDEVMNQQRKVIYRYRRNVLKGYDLRNEITEMIRETITEKVEEIIASERYYENWDLQAVCDYLTNEYTIPCKPEDIKAITAENLVENTFEIAMEAYQDREKRLGAGQMRDIERRSLLTVVDELWRDHLHEMDLLREGIGFRAYAQKDPLIEYKKEAFLLFQTLIFNINKNVTRKVFTIKILPKEQYDMLQSKINMEHGGSSAFERAKAQSAINQAGGHAPQQQPARTGTEKLQPRQVSPKIGRNDPCPCGSGKKYKKCCGRYQDEG